MKRPILLLSLALLLVSPALAQAQNPDSSVDPGLLPGNPFYNVEKAVEQVEVELAGIIGGPDLKAKAIANNAQKRLAEADALAERNQSQRATEAVKEYERMMNQSQKMADERNNTELSEQIRNVSGSNTERLEQVKEKVPEKAQKGIEKAIKNSKRNQKPEISGEDRNLRENLSKQSKTDKSQLNSSEAGKIKPGLSNTKQNIEPKNSEKGLETGNQEEKTGPEKVNESDNMSDSVEEEVKIQTEPTEQDGEETTEDLKNLSDDVGTSLP